MMYYVGVLTNETLPDATRVIEFSKGTYVLVKAEAATSEELKDTLTGLAFEQTLVEEQNYEYIGGPNADVEMGTRDNHVFGEMWIPVVEK